MANVLTESDLRYRVPSAFATEAWGTMSDRYKFVPTIDVVGILEDKGFLPIRAEQSRCRLPGKTEFTKHMIRFRHSEFFDLTSGTEFPEIVLVNSHDGSSGYQVMGGIHRVVCMNGLIVDSANLGSISVRHTGGSDFHDRILEATFDIVSETPATIRKIEGWKGLQLPAPIQSAFAESALELRDNDAIRAEQLLRAKRSDDRSSDLWTVFNRIQENMIRGGLRGYSESGRRTTTRPIKSVSEDVRLNRALWKLTERMAELAS
jgi:hypothetical protein